MNQPIIIKCGYLVFKCINLYKNPGEKTTLFSSQGRHHYREGSMIKDHMLFLCTNVGASETFRDIRVKVTI